MLVKADATAQKLRGGYYTPEKLANFIVKLFSDEVNNNRIKTVLEPSVGDGVFIKSIMENLDSNKIDKITAIEIIKDEAEKVANLVKDNYKYEIINDDFIQLYSSLLDQKPYDLILGNPPYIRYQYLTDVQRQLQSDILVSHSMKSNKLINAWVCFLVACVQLLSEGGKIAFIVPAELLQVAYAEDLRLFLSNNLSKITILAFEELIFDDIEQEVVVLIGEKSANEAIKNSVVGVKELKNLDCLTELSMDDIEYQPIEHSKEKWTKYFISDKDVELVKSIRNNSKFVTFDDISIVNVGITTGNNKYFSINENIVEEYELNNVVMPLIGRSSHAHGIYFTYEDWQVNVKEKKNAFLIKFPENIPFGEYPKKHRDYIKKGEDEEANVGYKCRIRDRWYIVPSVWIPDAFILRRNNTFPKFVINNVNAVSTDTMHRIKFNEGVDKDKALLSYYNSITFAFTEINGRSYGGGVLEILPGEVGKVVLPNIQDMDIDKVKYLLGIVDNTIRNNLPIDDMLDIIDKEVLVNHLGLDEKLSLKFRGIWKTLMRRRHSRSK
ncbi:Eco57I restriction-modification methylase domain-containing protein [Clostridium beijerinckii]|uniref:site-specific DNA-methyltransferase (adenine-specific) n=1 Tax=Clostridium beijerinckii TaxID=1520 RepID=A0A7X9SRS7_CLOBE|nr:N-6 DNA methylase [Clostridium beijerinckii]NMF06869.1 N-6 DNA methylase [Clostridium beijerinckii]